jgi:hypothetical protein
LKSELLVSLGGAPNERDVSRYLVFTEGYFSEKDEPRIRRALREAIRSSLSY